MTHLDGLLACPACRAPLEQPGPCDDCGRPVRLVDGWYLDAVDPGDLSPAHRDRLRPYERLLTPRLYDIDVRLSSATVWGAPLARQVGFNQAALEHAVRLGLPYLDLPVGTGLLLDRALRRADPPPTVVVADLSVGMLARARRRLGDAAVYVRASVDALPLRAGAFGAVHSANGLHVFPSLSDACGELARVVAAGGDLFATTWTNGGGAPARKLMGLLERRGLVNAPAGAATYVEALTSAGLDERAADVSGSLLLWNGTKRT